MFYSHDILTSPEHGVATIWLVATLGSRSVTRRFNRKAILDVDVTEACRVIINPDAPMALRLQGNLLYGVSRVFHQQCGYTLLDTQSMHDRMISMLKQIPKGGLDPNAGRTKPSNIVLPYDLAFLPETGLQGIDLSFIDILPDLKKSAAWVKSPDQSQSSMSQLGSIQLDFPSDLLLDSDLPNMKDDTDTISRKRGPDDEEGILLQPDFEFDEYGNIVEFDAGHISPTKRRRITPAQMGSHSQLGREGGFTMETDQLHEIQMLDDYLMEVDLPTNGNNVLLRESAVIEECKPGPGCPEERQQVQTKKARPIMPSDYNTTLRNTDLSQWNESYTAFMEQAAKNKHQNKMHTIAKNNAAFWVFGQGIGAVGTGLGAHREVHPLSCYAGNQFYSMLSGDSNTIKMSCARGDYDEESNTPTNKHRGGHQSDEADVEIGRDAPSNVLFDDHSSQAPWNITASIKSSNIGLHRSASDLSARGLHDSASFIGSRIRGRLTSASPLAGRGLRERLSSLTLQEDGQADLEDFEITKYLENELAEDNEDISMLSVSRRAVAIDRAVAVLDQESLSFFDFIKSKTEQSRYSGEISFSELLPPTHTTRPVATQGFMNVLTLATRGVLDVSQGPSKDAGSYVWPDRFKYGEIFMQPFE
ncbi:hypothetical protein N7495_007799 [Penicillium taxi]|uniref:uncharacterized protein n=1 Tax=Penicillium taxi TaxID=168475 RepID=UPI0025452C68|nr:uncharacterized protein N7495_007799 [Penicillium taxi]KAJ5887758.1 hypothetical protein N7495_007799 [Penicillium taxi]